MATGPPVPAETLFAMAAYVRHRTPSVAGGSIRQRAVSAWQTQKPSLATLGSVPAWRLSLSRVSYGSIP